MTVTSESLAAYRRRKTGEAPSAPASSTPAPGSYDVGASQSTARAGVQQPLPSTEYPLWDQLKSSFGNNPKGVYGNLAAEAFPAIGASLGAMATGPFGAPTVGAGLGAIGGEGLRQSIGQMTGQYTPVSQEQQESDMLASGATYAGAEAGAGALRMGGRFIQNVIERGGAKAILPGVLNNLGVEATAPLERMERLRNRAPQVMDPINRDRMTPARLANELRDKFNAGIQKVKDNWTGLENDLVQKYGDEKVVPVKGLKAELEALMEKYGYSEKKKMDKRAVQHFKDIIDDTVGSGDMTMKQAMNMNKRINRELKHAKTRAVDPNYSSDPALVLDMKESLLKRIDDVDSGYKKMREPYAAARQLERDAAPFLNSKDLPQALETADNKITTDFDLVNRMADSLHELSPVLEKMRDSIAGQSFRGPAASAFGYGYGYPAYAAQKINKAIPFNLVGPAMGVGANSIRKRD